MEVAILFFLVIAMLIIGVPIAISLGLSSIMFLLVLSDTSLASVAQSFFQAMAGHYTLLAIPFFILASSFMSTGGVAKRIIRFSIAIVGHFPGGLAIAGVFACMLFAALSGSSPATVVAIGTIVIAGMRQVGVFKRICCRGYCKCRYIGHFNSTINSDGGICISHRRFCWTNVSCRSDTRFTCRHNVNGDNLCNCKNPGLTKR